MKPEVVTVISSTFKIGMGETASEDEAQAPETGGFFAFPPDMRTLPTPTTRPSSNSTVSARGISLLSARGTIRGKRRSTTKDAASRS